MWRYGGAGAYLKRIVYSGTTSKQDINLTKRSKRNAPSHHDINIPLCAPFRHVATSVPVYVYVDFQNK